MATSDIKKGPLYVDSTNNRVGVGTASPATALDVTGTVTASGDFIRNDPTLGTSKFALQYSGADAAVFKRNNSSGVATIANGYAGAPVDAINISLTANVGIGTASPTQRLSVKGTNSTTGQSGADVTMDVYDDSTGGIDVGGAIGFRGNDGINSNVMFGEVSGRKENATSGNYASYMGFKTRADSGSLTERLRISSGGVITYNNDPTSGGGANITLSASYNDTSNHTVGGVNTQSFALITINTSNGATHIPVYRNGGAGVAYGGTMLDPDNQTWVALGASITFNQPGSFPQTFVVSITSGGSQLNVQRTSGSNAYSVYVQLLG